VPLNDEALQTRIAKCHQNIETHSNLTTNAYQAQGSSHGRLFSTELSAKALMSEIKQIEWVFKSARPLEQYLLSGVEQVLRIVQDPKTYRIDSKSIKLIEESIQRHCQ
jgi:hypothetical protein